MSGSKRTRIVGSFCLALAALASPAAAQTGSGTLGDAEIAAIVVAANRIDADMGEFAAARATGEAVRNFAATMTRDHRAVLQQAGELVARLGVTPAESDVSRDLYAGASTARDRLGSATGRDFDRAYVEHEIAFHEAVIKAVDDVLIPGAQNAELRKAIEDVRPALVAHLQHARQLKEGLR